MEFPSTKPHGVSIAPSTIIFVAAIILGLYFVYQVQQILALLFIAFILMVALNPVVKRFQGWGIRRNISIALAYVLLILTITTFLAIVVPPLVYQLIKLFEFLRDTPWLANELSMFSGNTEALEQELAGAQLSIDDLGSTIGNLSKPFNLAFSIVTAVFSNIFLVFSVLVMAFFMLTERGKLHLRLGWFTKDKTSITKAKDFLDSLELQLGGWVRGELILMFTIGLATYIGLTLLNIPYALPLAILAGLLELVPNLGPTIAAIPAIIIAFATHGPISGTAVLVFSIVIQQLENNFLVPKIMKESAHVSSLVVILAILIGAQLGGVLGALLAVPLYITIRSWYSYYLYPKLPTQSG